jgi:hypothetical protein
MGRPLFVSVLAVAVAVVAAAAYAADLLFLDYFGAFLVLTYALATFAGVGLIVALRRPRHPIGWLLLAAGACFSLGTTARAYAWRALVDAPGTLPGGELALWLATSIAPPGAAAFFIAAFLFPTGRLLSRRWVPLLVAGVALAAAQTMAWTFGPRPIRLPYALKTPPSGGLDTLPAIPNPAGISGPAGDLLTALLPAIDAAVGPLILLTLLAIVVRFVRSSGIERLQLKWFVYAVSLSIAFALGAGPHVPRPFSDLAWVLSEVFRALVPVAVGIAILRYRLYDIDVLINRTVVYGTTTAAIGAAFFLGLLGLQPLLRPLTLGSEPVIAASTLVSFALFQPIRRRVQEAVDRRFDRSRYDAARTLDAFANLLRDEVDLDALRADLLGAVRQTMTPAHTSLWLRERAR